MRHPTRNVGTVVAYEEPTLSKRLEGSTRLSHSTQQDTSWHPIRQQRVDTGLSIELGMTSVATQAVSGLTSSHGRNHSHGRLDYAGSAWHFGYAWSWLRPEVAERLAGVHYIIHAGDIGRPEVTSGLRKIAPVTAIKGNIDRGEWPAEVPGHCTRKARRPASRASQPQRAGLDPAAPESMWLYQDIRIRRKSRLLEACSISIREAWGHAVTLPIGSRRLS